MTLHSIASFPSARCYVLKLHRDADPAAGLLFGRLEHMAGGAWVDFRSGDELVAWLSRHAGQGHPVPAAELQPPTPSRPNADPLETTSQSPAPTLSAPSQEIQK